jgi:hypothetical protein
MGKPQYERKKGVHTKMETPPLIRLQGLFMKVTLN